jgi:hypothetical protein
LTSGMVMPSGSVTSRPPAANPGDVAACAKSHDLAVHEGTSFFETAAGLVHHRAISPALSSE